MGDHNVKPGSVAVYAAEDQSGNTLYIGQTGNFERRIAQHRRDSCWWKYADRVSVVSTHDSLEEALEQEEYLIKACHPRFNEKHGNVRGAREYKSLAAAEDLEGSDPEALRSFVAENELLASIAEAKARTARKLLKAVEDTESATVGEAMESLGTTIDDYLSEIPDQKAA